MSFAKYHTVVEDGDFVVVFSSVNSLALEKMKAGSSLQNRFGLFRHDDIIGKPYGCRIRSHNDQAWVTILYPTPELWTDTLPHRTQILYATDIAMVTMQLELGPGKVVCESGTGSGSLTHALARSVAPNGHVYTFDFHEGRVETAKKEFEEHGFGDIVTPARADAIKEGFQLEGVADAVFLDLPEPSKAIDTATRALKPTGRICSFSPCIEQVQATCLALQAAGYIDIVTLETLERLHTVKKCTLPKPYFGRTDEEEAAERELAASEKRRASELIPSALEMGSIDYVATPTMAKQRGHTGYLTFATKIADVCLPPISKRVKTAEAEGEKQKQ